MLGFRLTVIALLWSGVLLVTAIPASGQCEVHEDAKLTASDAASERTAHRAVAHGVIEKTRDQRIIASGDGG